MTRLINHTAALTGNFVFVLASTEQVMTAAKFVLQCAFFTLQTRASDVEFLRELCTAVRGKL
jgi:hypothetical protein